MCLNFLIQPSFSQSLAKLSVKVRIKAGYPLLEETEKIILQASSPASDMGELEKTVTKVVELYGQLRAEFPEFDDITPADLKTIKLWDEQPVLRRMISTLNSISTMKEDNPEALEVLLNFKHIFAGIVAPNAPANQSI